MQDLMQERQKPKDSDAVLISARCRGIFRHLYHRHLPLYELDLSGFFKNGILFTSFPQLFVFIKRRLFSGSFDCEKT